MGVTAKPVSQLFAVMMLVANGNKIKLVIKSAFFFTLLFPKYFAVKLRV